MAAILKKTQSNFHTFSAIAYAGAGAVLAWYVYGDNNGKGYVHLTFYVYNHNVVDTMWQITYLLPIICFLGFFFEVLYFIQTHRDNVKFVNLDNSTTLGPIAEVHDPLRWIHHFGRSSLMMLIIALVSGFNELTGVIYMLILNCIVHGILGWYNTNTDNRMIATPTYWLTCVLLWAPILITNAISFTYYRRDIPDSVLIMPWIVFGEWLTYNVLMITANSNKISRELYEEAFSILHVVVDILVVWIVAVFYTNTRTDVL